VPLAGLTGVSKAVRPGSVDGTVLTEQTCGNVVDKGHGRVQELADVLCCRGLGEDICCPEAGVACSVSDVTCLVRVSGMAYLVEKSMASSMLVTAWTSRQLSCTLRRRREDFLLLY
jgi:hypothetical protein